MSILINNYPVFEDNQVLTSGQLNQLNKYLDQQNRLTRACLIGMGIACGLELEFKNGAKPTLTIFNGMGISSEGYLLKLCAKSGSCITTQIRNYELPEGIVYKPFMNNNGKQDIELFELLSDNAVVQPEDEVFPIKKNFLKKKVVLLFLECLDKDLKSCLGKNCDELGIDRIFTLRKLLISKTDMDKVNARSNGGIQDTLFQEKFQLKEIKWPRVSFERSNINTRHYIPFAHEYIRPSEKYGEDLLGLLKLSYEAYKPILEDIYGSNPFGSDILQNAFDLIGKYMEGESGGIPFFGSQYLYDFFKDLILAYDEFRECAWNLMTECCPDMTRFPRHLMLGTALPSEIGKCELEPYRHFFTQPPIYNNNKYLLEKAISLHKRMVLLIEKLDLKRLASEGDMENKATPSCEKKSKLSQRAIPFYYDSKSESQFDRLENLEIEWNYDRKLRICQIQENHDEQELNALNLGYDNTNMEESYQSPLTTPLDFDLDPYDFIRIEGHLGKNVFEVASGLSRLKRDKNLSFDLKVIYLGDDVPNDQQQLAACIWSDLQPGYEIWRSKLFYYMDIFNRIVNISRVVLSAYGSRLISAGSDIGTNDNPTTGLGNSNGNLTGLNSRVNSIRHLGNNITSANWAFAADELLMNSKANNMKGLFREETGASLSATIANRVTITDLFEQMRNCLINLRAQTPEDIRRFDMDKWLPAYKCPLVTYVDIIKLIAERIDRQQVSQAVNTYMRLFCAYHQLLRNMAVFPFIDIRIYDKNIKQRFERTRLTHQFSNFLAFNPGLEHKAGFKQGETFVLLYQAAYSDREYERTLEEVNNYINENEILDIGIDQIKEFDEKLQGRIVGDFTLPYICCDPCANEKYKPAELDPIATPIVETVPIRQRNQPETGANSLEYGLVEEQILHNVYEQDRYKVELTSQAQFGDANLEFKEFYYNPDQNIQVLTYKVRVEAVQAALVNDDDVGYLIDTFDYQVRHTGNGDIVDSSQITILIPIIDIPVDPGGKVGVAGSVVRISDGIEFGISGALVTIVERPEFNARTLDNGQFTISSVSSVLPNGNYNVQVVATGFFPQTIPVTLNNQIEFITVTLTPIPGLVAGLNNFTTIMNFDSDSTEVITINNGFRKEAEMHRKEMKIILEAEGLNNRVLNNSEAILSRMSTDRDLSMAEINKIYGNNRNELIKDIQATTDRRAKANKTKALKAVTKAYLSRVTLMEPKKLSVGTAKTIAESASLMKRAKVNMKADMTKWFKEKDGLVGTTATKGIKAKFKLT